MLSDASLVTRSFPGSVHHAESRLLNDAALSLEFNHVSRTELLAAAGLDLAIHLHHAFLNDVLCLTAGTSPALTLEELIERELVGRWVFERHIWFGRGQIRGHATLG